MSDAKKPPIPSLALVVPDRQCYNKNGKQKLIFPDEASAKAVPDREAYQCSHGHWHIATVGASLHTPFCFAFGCPNRVQRGVTFCDTCAAALADAERTTP